MKKNQIILISSAILLIVATTGIILLVNHKTKKNIIGSLIKIAKGELTRWQGVKELSPKMSQTLVKYWKSVGLSFTQNDMLSASVHNSYAWSSAFISYLFFKAGAGDQFPYSSSHSGYFQIAKQNRDNKNAPLRGFRINEYAPKMGDLVVNTRQSGKGYDSTGHFASHGEVVVEVGKGYIKTIGGNVGNTVMQRTFKTNSKGLLEGNRVSFFMVIQNNIR